MNASLKWPFVPLKDRLMANRVCSRRASFQSFRYVRDLQARIRGMGD